MNEITTFAEATMSSREIADLVELRHDNVKRTIETLVARGVITSPQSEEKPTAGRPVTEYRIGQRDSYVIVAQLSPEFTGRLVDRWQELESRGPQKALIDLSDPASVRVALLQYTEKLIELEQKVERQAPAVEFALAVRNMEASIDMSRMARLIGWGRNNLLKRMRSDGILMANNLPYQHYMDRGYFKVIEGTRERSDGRIEPTFSTRVTGAGQVYLQRKYSDSTESA